MAAKDADSEWYARPITLPVGLLFGLVGPFLGAFLSSATAGDADTSEELRDLRMEVVRLNANVELLTQRVAEVRAIEEAAHPRYGVPPVPFTP